jgi:hypothetical protein
MNGLLERVGVDDESGDKGSNGSLSTSSSFDEVFNNPNADLSFLSLGSAERGGEKVI